MKKVYTTILIMFLILNTTACNNNSEIKQICNKAINITNKFLNFEEDGTIVEQQLSILYDSCEAKLKNDDYNGDHICTRILILKSDFNIYNYYKTSKYYLDIEDSFKELQKAC